MDEDKEGELVMTAIGSIFLLAVIGLIVGHLLGVIHIGKKYEDVAQHWTPPVMEPEQVSCKPNSKDRRCA